MNRTSLVALFAVGLLAGCSIGAPNEPGSDPDTTTLRLEAGDDGDFEWCDADGVCQSLPNPNQCAVLVVVIDNVTGQTCETCEDANGNTLSNTCEDTQVDCVIVTAPEPDCVVCAHTGGSVIYSTCVVEDPDYCAPAEANDRCSTCYDADGLPVSDDCPSCANVICPAIDCAPGYELVRRPGECCPSCAPAGAGCDDVACPYYVAVPDCPPGSILVRDPADCCRYYCEPIECPRDPAAGGGSDGSGGQDCFAPPPPACASDADCPDGTRCEAGMCIGEAACIADADCPRGTLCIDGICTPNDVPPPPECPPGYELSYEFPNCGACVPVDATRYCSSDADCGVGEVCTGGGDQCRMAPDCGGCWAECDANGSCYEVCADCPCQGICQPSGWTCPNDAFAAPAPADCQGGRWDYPGRDANGCPLPPVCMCPDGSIALDGVCMDQCALVDCAPMAIECPQGSHLEFEYPYCCGGCMPDDPCAQDVHPCAAVDCAPGYTCEANDKCEAICVPVPTTCYSDIDCASDQICTTSQGECTLPPDCAAGGNCITVCAGTCVPAALPSCYSSADCRADEICSVELGDCMPPPGCDDPSVPCPDVCTGRCLVVEETPTCTDPIGCP